VGDEGGKAAWGREEALGIGREGGLGVGVPAVVAVLAVVAALALLAGGVVGEGSVPVVLFVKGGFGEACARGGEGSGVLAGWDGGVTHGVEEVLQGDAV